jgi:uncharacterized membrane protein (UPF0127 family)
MAFLRNSTTGAIIATRVDRLSGFFQRAIGLLARTNVQRDEGVWISSCRTIHTMGMRCAIDVAFVDGDGMVVRICHSVEPNRFALSCRQAKEVIELGGGALKEIDVVVGDRLELVSTTRRFHLEQILRQDGNERN